MRVRWLLACVVMGSALAYAAYRLTADRTASVPSAPPGAGEAEPAPDGPRTFRKDGGFWTRRRPDASDEMKRLEALGYVEGLRPPATETGVRVFDPERAFAGLNLYSSAHAPEAILMDMHGRVLHRWSFARDRVWPELADVDPGTARKYFRRLHLFDNGDLLAIYEYTGLIRLDARSQLVWTHQEWDHHDLAVDSQDRIYVLVREARRFPRWPRDVWDEAIAILDPAGAPLGRISISASVERSRYATILDGVDPGLADRPFDLFHTNTVERLDGSLADRSPLFREGNFLFSMRNLSTIGIIDPDREELVWALRGGFHRQHQPVLLANGRILLFNNLAGPDRSQVIEFDPFTKKVTWAYPVGDQPALFSVLFGSSQRLSNGNTLITESEYGRVLEVTPEGEIVWEFVSPHTAGANDEFVAVIPELIRLPPDFPHQTWSSPDPR